MTKEQSLSELRTIPGIGKSLAIDLWNIGIKQISDLKGQDPEMLYALSNKLAGTTQDRCVLYTFRCAIYFASTRQSIQNRERLKWWNWKDQNRLQISVKKNRPGKSSSTIYKFIKKSYRIP